MTDKQRMVFLVLSLATLFCIESYLPTSSNQLLLERHLQNYFLLDAILAIVIGPIIEEFFFRYLIKKLLSSFLSPHMLQPVFVIFSSILFGLAHDTTDFLTFLMYFLTGVIYALLYVISGKIRTCIMVHSLYNAVIILFIFYL